VIAGLALPAAAQAATDLAITETPSARIVKAGETVSINVAISNRGPGTDEAVFVGISSLRGRGQGANNPYLSVSPSQGACKDNSGPAYGFYYYNWVCELGPMAAGAGAQIAAVVTVNETMNHFASLLPNAYEGGFQDGDNSNNEAVDRIAASTPPTLSGSKGIKLSGLPSGCATGDFTLRARTRAHGVKKMAASLFLGFNQEGEGQMWQKVIRGNRLVATVPASRIVPELLVSYELKVKAKRGGAKPLMVTVTFQMC
jgi:hypothetical protein